MLLNTAIQHKMSQADLPENIIVISDMEFDQATGNYSWGTPMNEREARYREVAQTVMEIIASKWQRAGYEVPRLVFWNVQARQNNIPMLDSGKCTFVSGFSPVLFEQIMKGLTAWDLMMDKLDSDRYACIK